MLFMLALCARAGCDSLVFHSSYALFMSAGTQFPCTIHCGSRKFIIGSAEIAVSAFYNALV
jgi:hypothetical protein